jgi:hypothetical protein
MHPRLIVYEDKHLSLAERARARALLAAAGYRLESSGSNSVAVDPAFFCA